MTHPIHCAIQSRLTQATFLSNQRLHKPPVLSNPGSHKPKSHSMIAYTSHLYHSNKAHTNHSFIQLPISHATCLIQSRLTEATCIIESQLTQTNFSSNQGSHKPQFHPFNAYTSHLCHPFKPQFHPVNTYRSHHRCHSVKAYKSHSHIQLTLTQATCLIQSRLTQATKKGSALKLLSLTSVTFFSSVFYVSGPFLRACTCKTSPWVWPGDNGASQYNFQLDFNQRWVAGALERGISCTTKKKYLHQETSRRLGS